MPDGASLGDHDADAAFAFLVGHVCYAVIFTVESLGGKSGGLIPMNGCMSRAEKVPSPCALFEN